MLKKIITFSLFLSFFSVFQNNGYSQVTGPPSCEITTTNDNNWLNSYFTVRLYTYVTSVTTTATGGDCNMTATIQYYIEFVPISGNPPPPDISTLQGRVTCDGQSMFFDLPNGPSTGNSGIVTSANSGGHSFNPSPGNCSGYTTANCGTSVQIEIHGSGIPNQTINCTSQPVIVLATRLVSFDVNSDDNKNVILSWVTSSESGTSHYKIEHADESGIFEEIATVKATGFSNKVLNNYAFEHSNQKGGVHYYRISEVSTEGETNPLSLKAINLQSPSDITIFPNPAAEGNPVTIFYSAKKETNNAYIEFYSSIGNVVKRLPLNNENSTYRVELPKGHYITRLIEDSESVTVGKLTVF